MIVFLKVIKRSLYLCIVAVLISTPVICFLIDWDRFAPKVNKTVLPTIGYLENLEQKALAGDGNAMFRMGNNYKYGYNGLKQNNAEAVKWYTMAVDENYADAMNSLGSMLKQGEGVPQDYQKAIDLFERAISLNNGYAFSNLGVMYREGEGVQRDYKKAIDLFQSGANVDNTHSMANLGSMYHEGLGVEKDLDKTFFWYEKAADSGLVEAQYILAELYEKNPKNVPNDYLTASEYYAKAALQKNEYSKDLLGYFAKKCSKNKQGLQIKYDMKFCYLAAYSADPKAMHAVGLSYLDGRGEQIIDYKKAFQWLKKSAEAGFSGGQFHLALLYEKGMGVDPNPLEAYVWIGRAINKNDLEPTLIEKAIKARDVIYSEMSISERALAQKKLKELP